MSEENSLVGALSAEEQAVVPVTPAVQKDVAQTAETSQAQAAPPGGQGLIDETERAATMAHLRALALANQERQGGSLSASVAELKRLQATQGNTALSDISGGAAGQN